jgi:probable HAF family extracellular repeat protein
MKLGFRSVATLTTALALSASSRVVAQTNSLEAHGHGYHRYAVINFGTLGGPTSGQITSLKTLNNQGTVVGIADLDAPDPYAPNCLQNCFESHAIEWEHGSMRDLGALPVENDSIPFSISDSGLVAGASENGLIDSLTGFPQLEPILWTKVGTMVRLGGLGGNTGLAINVNSRGDVVGAVLNIIPDQFGQSFLFGLPTGTQSRAVLWQHGSIRDLGTLGGPDAGAYAVNEGGQIAGMSYTNAIPNATTGIPTLHPFLWDHGRMVDIGTLGGTRATLGDGAAGFNNRGQVAGTSTLAGDQIRHAFFWDRGVLQDLGTLGGANSEEFYLSETAEVVGRADFSPSSTDHHAFSWKRGVMRDLGTLGNWPCSTAVAANSKGQVVGDTGICNIGGGPPFLSEDGEPMVDLSSLVLPGSGLELDVASVGVAFINERGEISGQAPLPNGDTRAILLVPCDRSHADVNACEGHIEELVTRDMLPPTRSALRATPLAARRVNSESRSSETLSISGLHRLPK